MVAVATLMTEPHNYAVVQLPGRQFPGVVVQGDSLNNIVSLIKGSINEPDENERFEILKEVEGILSGALEGYKKVLLDADVELPFNEEQG